MTASKEVIEANRKYNDKHYDRITLTVHKGDREKIRKFVKKNYPGVSVNSFIKRKIKEDIPNLKD